MGGPVGPGNTVTSGSAVERKRVGEPARASDMVRGLAGL